MLNIKVYYSKIISNSKLLFIVSIFIFSCKNKKINSAVEENNSATNNFSHSQNQAGLGLLSSEGHPHLHKMYNFIEKVFKPHQNNKSITDPIPEADKTHFLPEKDLSNFNEDKLPKDILPYVNKRIKVQNKHKTGISSLDTEYDLMFKTPANEKLNDTLTKLQSALTNFHHHPFHAIKLSEDALYLYAGFLQGLTKITNPKTKKCVIKNNKAFKKLFRIFKEHLKEHKKLLEQLADLIDNDDAYSGKGLYIYSLLHPSLSLDKNIEKGIGLPGKSGIKRRPTGQKRLGKKELKPMETNLGKKIHNQISDCIGPVNEKFIAMETSQIDKLIYKIDSAISRFRLIKEDRRKEIIYQQKKKKVNEEVKEFSKNLKEMKTFIESKVENLKEEIDIIEKEHLQKIHKIEKSKAETTEKLKLIKERKESLQKEIKAKVELTKNEVINNYKLEKMRIKAGKEFDKEVATLESDEIKSITDKIKTIIEDTGNEDLELHKIEDSLEKKITKILNIHRNELGDIDTKKDSAKEEFKELIDDAKENINKIYKNAENKINTSKFGNREIIKKKLAKHKNKILKHDFEEFVKEVEDKENEVDEEPVRNMKSKIQDVKEYIKKHKDYIESSEFKKMTTEKQINEIEEILKELKSKVDHPSIKKHNNTTPKERLNDFVKELQNSLKEKTSSLSESKNLDLDEDEEV